MDRIGDGQHESYRTPREDLYDYCDFPASENPEGVLIAKQIQAQSYVNSGFVRTEGLITLANGEQILAPDIADPSDLPQSAAGWTEYSLGVEKNSNLDPINGELVAWKKRYADLDSLPTYIFCEDSLWPGWEEYLRDVDIDESRQLVEPEALGKTKNAGPGVIVEFMRNEIQRSFGRHEVWFMGLVEDTVSDLFERRWGPLAVRQVGESKRLDHPYINPDVKLVPTIMDIDNFYLNFYYYLQNQEARGEVTDKQLNHFLYMASGMSDAQLGEQVAGYRNELRQRLDRTDKQ
ncbi:hypothetical protein KDA14_04695 [Candidatus Saccharibacteria bacterium]|nr:hypothetical protein [Candidatus Saccharibacteria bacterium]